MKEPAEGSEVKTKSKRGKKKNGRKKGQQGDDNDDNGGDNCDGGDNYGGDYDDGDDGGDDDGESSSSSSHGVGGAGAEMEIDSNLETVLESSNDRIHSDGGDGVADSAGEHGDSTTPNRKKSRNIIMSEF